MGTRHDSEPRPTAELDPAMMRELLAKQRRLATGSGESPPEAKPTVQMEPLSLNDLRSACAPDPELVALQAVLDTPARVDKRTETTLPLIPPRPPATVAQSRARHLLILAGVATLSALWLVAAAYLIATW
jgi:hypothetical protein